MRSNKRMIQEVLGGSGSGSTNKIDSSSSSSISVSPSSCVRCPRCDSSNTKFCYYNNYNLTQPRHFCKTCRRYWTKGGALRNVPIGGACRKNKIITPPSPPSYKLKTPSPSSSCSVLIPSTPIIWASSPNSHFLSTTLIRSSSNPNDPLKHLEEEEELSPAPNSLFPTSSSSSSDHLQYSLHRINQTQQAAGLIYATAHDHNAPTFILGNMPSSAILAAPPPPDEFGFWNPAPLSWPPPPPDSAYPPNSNYQINL